MRRCIWSSASMQTTPGPIPHHSFAYFAVRCLWQLFDELPALWQLVPRQPRGAPLLEMMIRISIGITTKNDISPRNFAPFRICGPYNSSLEDRRMDAQHFFNLFGINILAAAYDNISFAVND